MLFFTSTAIIAFASIAAAQNPTAGFDPITSPAKGEVVPAGSTYEIDWDPTDKYNGTVTITLLGGASAGTLQDVQVIAQGIDNAEGEYDWPVASTLGKDVTYGIRISLDSDKTIFQYSNPFSIKGSTSSSSSTSSSISSSASVSASSTSSGSTANKGSSSASSGSATTSSTVTKTSASSTVTVSPSSSLSTTSVGTTKTVTTLTSTSSTSATGSKTSTSVTSVPSSEARTVTTSAFALFGGIAMALFAF